MPVFWLLVVLAAAILWVLLSSVFVPLGKLVSRIWKDAVDAMQEENPGENNEKRGN